jgi:hypothetical protein
MEATPDFVLSISDGRRVRLLNYADVHAAVKEMTALTGGSSGGGRWSYLWGLDMGEGRDPLSPAVASRLGAEAADFQAACGNRLSRRTKVLLSVIASLSADAK